jgi:putative transcriptional regulator
MAGHLGDARAAWAAASVGSARGAPGRRTWADRPGRNVTSCLGKTTSLRDNPPVNRQAHEPRLANRLRVARAERAMSQGELAAAAGVSRQTISSVETGQYTPSALLAFRLALVLGVPVDGLFWLEGDEP